MEKNNVSTVKLTLFEYNNLRDFKENIEKNNTVFINDTATYTEYIVGGGRINESKKNLRYISTDDAVKEIAEINAEILKTNAEILKKYDNLINNKEEELTIDKIKKLSIWQFLKWKTK
jgi:CRISPR/Cas system-associated protein Cas10 (large subunit of type III CRISPR-Cas system)